MTLVSGEMTFGRHNTDQFHALTQNSQMATENQAYADMAWFDAILLDTPKYEGRRNCYTYQPYSKRVVRTFVSSSVWDMDSGLRYLLRGLYVS